MSIYWQNNCKNQLGEIFKACAPLKKIHTETVNFSKKTLEPVEIVIQLIKTLPPTVNTLIFFISMSGF